MKLTATKIGKILALGLALSILSFGGITELVSLEARAKKVKLALKVPKTASKDSSKAKKSGKDADSDNRKALKIKADCDTVVYLAGKGETAFLCDSVIFAGYDKGVSASKEAFHLVNRTDATLTGFSITITYLDMQGRMLHKRDVNWRCNVPAKETRLIEIPTWDRQKSYYYHLGKEPRSLATPYDVAITPLSFTIK